MHSPHHPPRGLRGLAARFNAAAGAIEMQPLLDPRSRVVYALIAVAGAVELALLLLTDFTFDNRVFFRLFAALLAMLGAGLLARRYGMPRIATGLELLVLPGISGALISTGAFMVTAASLPLADSWLAAMDKALGFDWLALFGLYQRHPELVGYSRYAYNSLFTQLPLVPFALVCFGHERRAWTFVTAWTFAGCVTAAIHPIFPAAGPYVTYGVKPGDLPGIVSQYPWATQALIESVRSGEQREITAALGGLVSFPSFHAAAAIMLAWASAPLRVLRAPLILLNGAMWCSTVIMGSHYFVDLMAGTVVAVLSIWAAQIVTRSSGGHLIANPMTFPARLALRPTGGDCS